LFELLIYGAVLFVDLPAFYIEVRQGFSPFTTDRFIT